MQSFRTEMLYICRDVQSHVENQMVSHHLNCAIFVARKGILHGVALENPSSVDVQVNHQPLLQDPPRIELLPDIPRIKKSLRGQSLCLGTLEWVRDLFLTARFIIRREAFNMNAE
uniref:Non-structural polyprotein n=1 Tax=Anthurium amnicola TaxID=1678845 RepID=A0A1D1XUE0_9ARAE